MPILPGKLHLGTSGYSYPDWIGTVWPERLRSADAFQLYCRYFDSLELNRSFYHVPKAETVRRYRETGGPDMTWVVKGHRRFTHDERLQSPPEAVQAFVERVQPLLREDGVLLFQLPRSLTLDLALLDQFLTTVPKTVRSAIEFRHPSWFCSDVYQCLERHGVALVSVDAPNVPRVTDVRTASFTYYRLHGRTEWYLSVYSRSELEELGEFVRRDLERGDVYVYFDNTKQGHGFHNAVEFRKMMSAVTNNQSTVSNVS